MFYYLKRYLCFIINYFPLQISYKKSNDSLLYKTNYSRKQIHCFSASRVRRDPNKFKYSSKLKGWTNLFAFLIFVNARIINRKEKKNLSQIIIDTFTVLFSLFLKFPLYVIILFYRPNTAL